MDFAPGMFMFGHVFGLGLVGVQRGFRGGSEGVRRAQTL